MGILETILENINRAFDLDGFTFDDACAYMERNRPAGAEDYPKPYDLPAKLSILFDFTELRLRQFIESKVIDSGHGLEKFNNLPSEQITESFALASKSIIEGKLLPNYFLDYIEDYNKAAVLSQAADFSAVATSRACAKLETDNYAGFESVCDKYPVNYLAPDLLHIVHTKSLQGNLTALHVYMEKVQEAGKVAELAAIPQIAVLGADNQSNEEIQAEFDRYLIDAGMVAPLTNSPAFRPEFIRKHFILSQKLSEINKLPEAFPADKLILKRNQQNPIGYDVDLEASIQAEPELIKYVESPSESLCMVAVTAEPAAIRFIDDPSENTQFIAVVNSGHAIEFIKDPSEEICSAAIQQTPAAIAHIASPSREMQKLAVTRDPLSISLISSPALSTQLTAIKKDWNALREIEYPASAAVAAAREIFEKTPSSSRTDEIEDVITDIRENYSRLAPSAQAEYVKKDPDIISLIDNPTEEIMTIAANSGCLLSSLPAPSEKITTSIISRSFEQITSINRPSEAVQLAAIEGITDRYTPGELSSPEIKSEINNRYVKNFDLPVKMAFAAVSEAESPDSMQRFFASVDETSQYKLLSDRAVKTVRTVLEKRAEKENILPDLDSHGYSDSWLGKNYPAFAEMLGEIEKIKTQSAQISSDFTSAETQELASGAQTPSVTDYIYGAFSPEDLAPIDDPDAHTPSKTGQSPSRGDIGR